MIRIKDLTEVDVGRWVDYTRWGRTPKVGRVKHWNQSLIFVVYNCDEQWDRYSEFTAEGTFPEDLEFHQPKNS